jgi:hypothetical protein
MSLRALIDEARAALTRKPEARAQELNRPSGHEPGLRHRHNGGHVLCRDDAVVELSSGPGAAVLVDGPAQSVTAQGAAVQLVGERVAIQAPPGGFYVGYQRLNPYWFSQPLDPTFLLKAPLVPLTPASMTAAWVVTTAGVPGAVPLTALGVTGPEPVTAAGVPVFAAPVAAFFQAVPLFGPNEQLLLLAQNLGQMLQSLALPGS